VEVNLGIGIEIKEPGLVVVLILVLALMLMGEKGMESVFARVVFENRIGDCRLQSYKVTQYEVKRCTI
jgi:hypothetical protein